MTTPIKLRQERHLCSNQTPKKFQPRRGGILGSCDISPLRGLEIFWGLITTKMSLLTELYLMQLCRVAIALNPFTHDKR